MGGACGQVWSTPRTSHPSSPSHPALPPHRLRPLDSSTPCHPSPPHHAALWPRPPPVGLAFAVTVRRDAAMGTRLLRPLSEAQLKRLEDHRYRAAGRSLFEPALQLYWCWLLNLVPAWLAPNAITLLGLATNLLSTLLLVYHCPGGTEQVSSARGPTGREGKMRRLG